MIRRLIIALLVAIPVVALIAVLGLAGLLLTGPGHKAALRYALPRLESTTGLRIAFDRVGGAWPNRVSFEGLVLSDERGVWLTARTLVIDWHPLALLDNRIAISLLAVDGGDFTRDPVIRGTRAPGAKQSIPEIAIGTVRLKRFHIGAALIDQEAMLDLSGNFTLRDGKHLGGAINADIDTPGDFPKSLQSLLGTGFKLNGKLSGDIHGRIVVQGVNAVTRDGRLKIEGPFGYDVPRHEIHVDADIVADHTLASWISSELSTDQPIMLKAQLDGRVRQLTIKAEAQLGDIRYGTQAIPPLNATADFVRTREQVAGPVTVEFLGPKVQGAATGKLTYVRSGRIRIEDLVANYGAAKLTGALDLETEPLAGDIVFDTNIPELAALPLPDLKGDLKASGRIHLSKPSSTINAVATSAHLVAKGVELKSASVKANGSLDRLIVEAKLGSLAHPAVAILRDTDFAGTVAVKGDTTALSFERLNAKLGSEVLRLAGPARIEIGPERLSLSKLDIFWGDLGQFTGSAERSGDNLKAALKIVNFEPPQLPSVISGTIDVDTRRAVAGTLALTFVPTVSARAEVQMKLDGKWNRKRLALTAAFEGYGDDAALKRIVPLNLSLPLALGTGKGLTVSIDGPIKGRLAYQGPITPFVAFAPLPEQSLIGQAMFDLRVSGTTKAPVFGGTVSLKAGTYEHVGHGVLLDRLNVEGRVKRNGRGYVLSADLTASDGTTHAADAMPVKANAIVTLGTSAPHVEAAFTFDQSRLVHSERVTAVASGRLDVAGTLPNLAAKGDFTLQSFEFTIPNSLPGSVVEIKVVAVDAQGKPIQSSELPIEERTPVNVTLDVSVKAADHVYIRGRGLDSEWGADLRLIGTKDDPRISGPLTLRKGRFDFSGRRFELTRGVIGFVPSRTLDPDLSVEARYTAPSNMLAYIRVSGRSSAPRITLSSDPPQAEEDVMSLILFGKPAKEMSAFEAVQAADAIGRLTGTGPFAGPSILDRARTTLGLDLLDLSISAGAQGISVGKYIQERIYVSARQGLTGQPGSVSVNVDVNKWLSVKTDVGQDSQSSVGVFWKKDY